MELNYNKLIFCFPYKHGPGGVNMLFLRLATYLHKKGFNTAIVDYPDGDMANNKDEFLELIPYYDDKLVRIPEDALIIFQSMTPWSIYPMLDISDKCKLFFLTTLPSNFYTVLPGFFRNRMYKGEIIAKLIWNTLLLSEYRKTKVFIDLIEAKSSHVILDEDILCNIEKSLSLKILSPKYLPLFSQDVESNKYLSIYRSESNVINLCWVGRLADFKVSILNRVISDIYNYAEKNNQNIVFTIIGNGDYKKNVVKKESRWLKFVDVSYIVPGKLDDFLLTQDMLFAMGTSALDGARLGLPVVRLDYSYTKIPDYYLYKYFYEIKGFSLGQKVSRRCFFNGGHTMSDILGDFKQSRDLISNKNYEFYKKNHSISAGSSLFLEYIDQSSLVWSDLKEKNLLDSFIYGLWNKYRNN